jgi:small GTP-binding protein
MDTDEATAMLLTPRGADAGGSAIAVVRLRGRGALEFLQKHFSKPIVAGRPVHGELKDAGQTIDDPVVVIADDGGFADINLHGGAAVIGAVFELARRDGFTSVENHISAMDIAFDEAASTLQREMLALLPLARTELALRALLEQPAAWAAAMQEETLDYSAILLDRSLWWLLHPPQVALVGAPNVGKSTLANQLFGRERSITADVAGTTRDWVGEIANIDGLAVVLVDTPGMRGTVDPLEAAAIRAGAEKIQESDLVIHVLDAACEPSGDIEESAGLIVINKTDCPPAWDFSRIRRNSSSPGMAIPGLLNAEDARRPLQFIPISAKTGHGIDLLRRQIAAQFGVELQWKSRPCWWTDRQRDALRRALDTCADSASLASQLL